MVPAMAGMLTLAQEKKSFASFLQKRRYLASGTGGFARAMSAPVAQLLERDGFRLRAGYVSITL